MKSVNSRSGAQIPYPWNLDLEEIETKLLEEETQLLNKQKEIKRNEMKEMGRATTKTMKDAAKKKAQKANQPLIDACNQIKYNIQELQEVQEAKIPIQDKLPKDSIYYKHLMQKTFNDKIAEQARQQIQSDKMLMENIKDEIKK